MRYPIFDLDGTLVDSDEALIAAFVRCGVRREDLGPLGQVLAVECAQHELTVERYLAAYRSADVRPYDGVPDLVGLLDQWSVCSNKSRASGMAELDQFGWVPEIGLFTDDFGGGPKSLVPVLEAIGWPAEHVVFVGDTEHDLRCARAVGCTFAAAGWNPRALALADDADVVLRHPLDLLEVLGEG